jgi:glc operon protein GlcG
MCELLKYHPVSGRQIVGLVTQNALFAIVFKVFCVVTLMNGIEIADCVMLGGQFFHPHRTMKTQSTLELSDVQTIAAAAQAEAQKNNWAVSIAIVDAGGHLLHFQRLDGAAPISSHIAPAKAKTAALGQRESKVYEDVINGGRYSFLSAPTIEGMLEGGVPIMKDGACLGAVGVSGVKSPEDAQIAKAGIAAIGL